MSEITRWPAMSGAEQWEVLRRVAERKERAVADRVTHFGDVTMDAIERIKTQLGAAPVVLYMKGTPDFPQCGFSAQTVGALRASRAKFAHVNIFEDPEVREALKTYSNWPTFPQLYVNGELIGGCDIVVEMYKSGELKQVLAEAGALAA
jgi:monothiol glutaredoxin